MNGMELARRFYAGIALPAFQRQASDLLPELAWGLVGPGSECYGLDDEISRDHDWGPRVCVWVSEPVFEQEGERLARIYDSLDTTFLGYGPIRRLDPRFPRDGVMSTERFYRTYLGTAEPPATLRDWLLFPEEALSLCTNGEVFADPRGEFSRMRDTLLGYFPRDLWLKKIASRCKAAARHGQYNLTRARKRADSLTALYHTAQFAREASALTCLLYRTYRTVDKWLFAGLLQLGDLGSVIHHHLALLADVANESAAQSAVEECATALVDRMFDLKLITRRCSFLWECGTDIERSIEEATLRDGLDMID